MAENPNMNPEERIITLTNEDGETMDFLVVALFEAGGQGYAVLMPNTSEAKEAGEVHFCRYEEDSDGKPELSPILTKDEFEMVVDIFKEIMEQNK